MVNKEIVLKGRFVELRGLIEEDFPQIIKWRNDPEINRFLNQPYQLTLELQYKWYQDKYLKSNEILFVIIEQKNFKKIGTIGVNDLNFDNKTGILGRLLIGEKEYRGSRELIEAMVLIYDFIFNELELNELYGHCVKENKQVISFDKKFGFVPTENTLFPQYCFVNNMHLVEMVNTKEQYERTRKSFIALLDYYWNNHIIGKIRT
ncbi:RimJ/RimL family protein N-acetyltransferase [Anaerosolibacter carboniphilus]|uniref:RimJ/RimL family protein N-acetyltransferase n=1 Tax=Anaerosolibacter carboniphilus TaxID=1417629 RepID=A0A841KRR3_9FIRM|nr:GNAT family N-acetyltransferase [Anaerosolibacter carboniphilus]MBB6216434.1 RimJ/RimL family protein N-acetyltransferase [Anaerosolibacter carboniphilus]